MEQLNQSKMEDERDEYQCPSCGEMRDVEKMCNTDGACDDCQETETYPCPQCQDWGYVRECRDNCNKKFIYPKTITNSEGRTEWVGKYLFD